MIGALPNATATDDRPSVWRRVLPFLALAFGLTWLLDLALWLGGGYGSQQTLTVLQLQMLIPAACAIFLGFLSTRFGSRQVRESVGQARALFFVFLAFTVGYVALSVAALALPDLAVMAMAMAISQILMVLSVLALVVLRLARGGASFRQAGLSFGKPVHWLVYGAGFVLYYVAQTALNRAFGLGSSPDLAPMAATIGLPVDTFLIVAIFQSVIVGSFLGIVIAFGEEYGWRGFLQGEMVRLGRVRGIFLLGLIWGLWHAPVIAMGHNYPGYPIAGIFLMIAYSTLLAFVLGYVMLKTGSIWLVAFLHALNNQVYAAFISLVYTPSDPVFQFGAGIYGTILLALVVALLLRDRIWKDG